MANDYDNQANTASFEYPRLAYLCEYYPYQNFKQTRHWKEQGQVCLELPSPAVLNSKSKTARPFAKRKSMASLQPRVRRFIQQNIAQPFVVVVVPSSTALPNELSLLQQFVKKMLLNHDRADVTSVAILQRHTTIQKATKGGQRDIQTHLASIEVSNKDAIRGKHVLLIDDVTTSGSSLWACHHLLQEAGAAGVTCLAFGKTVTKAMTEEDKFKPVRGCKNLYFGSYIGAEASNLQENNVVAVVSIGNHPTFAQSINVLRIDIEDVPGQIFLQHFHDICNFIDHHLANGRVFVHCWQGKSRSLAAVQAYMIFKGIPLEDDEYSENFAQDLRLFNTKLAPTPRV